MLKDSKIKLDKQELRLAPPNVDIIGTNPLRSIRVGKYIGQ